MVRQNADCDCFERMTLLNGPIGRAKKIDMFRQRIARSISQRDRKEERAALYLRAEVSRHGASGVTVVGTALRADAHPTNWRGVVGWHAREAPCPPRVQTKTPPLLLLVQF